MQSRGARRATAAAATADGGVPLSANSSTRGANRSSSLLLIQGHGHIGTFRFARLVHTGRCWKKRHTVLEKILSGESRAANEELTVNANGGYIDVCVVRRG